MPKSGFPEDASFVHQEPVSKAGKGRCSCRSIWGEWFPLSVKVVVNAAEAVSNLTVKSGGVFFSVLSTDLTPCPHLQLRLNLGAIGYCVEGPGKGSRNCNLKSK